MFSHHLTTTQSVSPLQLHHRHSEIGQLVIPAGRRTTSTVLPWQRTAKPAAIRYFLYALSLKFHPPVFTAKINVLTPNLGNDDIGFAVSGVLEQI
jgi:hypothetical protein